jgi:MFS family permease
MWPAAAATMIDRTEGGRRATAMGALNMCFLSGLALGPTLGLFVAAFFHKYVAGFYVASGLLLTAGVLAALTFQDSSPAHRPTAASAPRRTLTDWARTFFRVRRSPTLLVMLLVGFVQTAGIGLLTPILVIYAHEVVGISDQGIGIVFLVIVLAVAAASVPGGRLADHIGRQRVVIWGMIMAAIGMWLLPFAQRGNFAILTGAAVLLGGSYAMSSPAWLALMSDAAPAGGTGMAMGASETAQGAGLIVGPLLGGVFYDHLGPRSPFVASAILLTAGMILAVLVLRPRWEHRAGHREFPPRA